MTQTASVTTFGFRPVGDVVENVHNRFHRKLVHGVLSDMHLAAPDLSEELDSLFARGASEAEIAEFRIREAAILATPDR